ncbi:hypothetical protein TELCIR_12862 [Teladorsagia circumcincta]|uniref:Protein kinase domain-containing protein n=1 Tax=Teladorsagia circumcincta TaxID=45464 RepID=A0A2G9U5D2_TELCI|nr:hypothetical protein TELCIR_12862 [Teladorsagia circumcincta]
MCQHLSNFCGWYDGCDWCGCPIVVRRIRTMMVARVKADSRVVRSEPPTYVSINEESEHSEVEEQEEEVEEPGGKVGKFVPSRRSHDEAPTHKPRYVALGKRIGFYRLGKELGSGNFSKVKLGIHVLTKVSHQIAYPSVVYSLELRMGIRPRGTPEHKNNLVHRDIKAENIMFSAPGVVKLVDFGFSCMLPSAAEQLKTFCGSPPYAAPELFRDESYNGPKVDIWALGVLLHFMLIGVTPFRGETVPELKTAILQGTFNLPMYLEHASRMLIESMLSKDPFKRPKIEDIRVWKIMNSYGITEQMLEESSERGPRNALIGTYRIVQYQVQTAVKEPVSLPMC